MLHGGEISKNSDFRKYSCGRKTLTNDAVGDINVSMAFEKVLRGLIKRKGLRKAARDLGINHGSLYRSMMDGSNVGLDRIEAILNLFGLELKAVKRKEVKPINQSKVKKGGELNGSFSGMSNMSQKTDFKKQEMQVRRGSG